MTTTDGTDPQAVIGTTVLFLARWNDGVQTYAPGRLVATAGWPAGQYQNLKNGGVVGDTLASADSQTPGTPLRGTIIGAATDSSGRLLIVGSAAGVSAADAALFKNDGKLDSSVLPAPVLSGVSATALGGGSVRFSWTSNQLARATIQYGPTTGYAGGSFTAPAGSGPQSYIFGPIALGVTHYLVTIVSAWGTTPGVDQTVTVT